MCVCGEGRHAFPVMELFLRIRMDSCLQIAHHVPVYLFRAIVLRRQKYINATEDINVRITNLRKSYSTLQRKIFMLRIYFDDINFFTFISLLFGKT